MSRISEFSESMETHFEYFAQSKEYPELHDLTGHAGALRLAKSIQGTHHNEDSSRDPEDDGREKYLSIRISRKDHLHEDVQRHGVVDQADRINMPRDRVSGRNLCSRFRAWSLSFSDREMNIKYHRRDGTLSHTK